MIIIIVLIISVLFCHLLYLMNPFIIQENKKYLELFVFKPKLVIIMMKMMKDKRYIDMILQNASHIRKRKKKVTTKLSEPIFPIKMEIRNHHSRYSTVVPIQPTMASTIIYSLSLKQMYFSQN